MTKPLLSAKLVRILIFIGTPVLFFLSFPPFPVSVLAFLCLIPFLALLTDRPGRGFRDGYLTGLMTVGLFLYWINFNSGATLLQAMGMYLAMTVYLALWWGAFAYLQKKILQRTGDRGLMAAPFLWTALEYAQSFGALGFPWHSLATTQVLNPRAIQFIALTGMYGITFWLVSANVMIYLLIRRWFPVQGENNRNASKHRWILPAALAVWILLPLFAGSLIRRDSSAETVTSLRVAILQPNIEPNRKWLERDFAFNRLMEMTRSVRDSVKDLILWPETAIPSRLRYDTGKMKQILDELRLQQCALLTGIPDKRIAQNEQGEFFYRHFNSVFLIHPDSSVQIYDKIHLVPLGEYVPDFLFLIEYLAMDVGYSGYSAGEEPVVFRLRRATDTLALASVICYESVFSGLVREFVTGGAELIVVVTNDAWYDGTVAPDQHAAIAVLRAIEHQIPVIRCANSGVSCVITSDGQMTAIAPNPSQAVLLETIPIGGERTFFTRTGDWFPLMMVTATILFVIAGFYKKITSALFSKIKPR